jgi:hypothetical protein
MDVTQNLSRDVASRPRSGGAPHRAFGVLLMVLGAALVLNTVLGPLVAGVVDYPVSETVRNQLIGLEVVSVALVAPLSIIAGVLALRGHPAAGVLGFGPAAYTAYMFVQYVLGPEYRTYGFAALFQLAIFTLGGALAIRGWVMTDTHRLPVLTRRRERLYGAVMLALAAFVLTRYLGAIAGAFTHESITAEFAEAPTFYWSIFLLDVGVVVPATAFAGVALIRGVRSAHTALYAILGWFVLVPPSVAAMAAAMAVNGDPYGSPGQAVLLGVVAVVFAAFAVTICRPLFARPGAAG